MKKLITILSLLLISTMAMCQQTLLEAGQQEVAYSHGTTWGTSPIGYVYLPWDYNYTSHSYPVIIFFSGDGQYGGDITNELTDGLPEDINNGIIPYSVSGGDTTWFIVISGHAPDQYHVDANIQSLYSTCLSSTGYNLRIDTNRAYVTGLSQGGETSYSANQVDWTDGYKAAAIVSMSPAHGMNSTYYTASNYDGIPIWCIGGNNDATVGQSAQGTYNFLTAANGQQDYRLTIYSGGHSGWTTFYNPTWTDENADVVSNSPDTTGKNIYDWMAQFTKASSSNNPPVANAGSDQTLASGSTSATLSGSGTDSDGSIANYSWTTSSGVTITSPSSASTTVTGLSDGNSYTFTLTVTDNSGATATDNVTVNVLSNHLVLNYDFSDPGDGNADWYPSDGLLYKEAAESYSFATSTDYERDGNPSARFELKYGDPEEGGSARSELSTGTLSSYENWVGFSLYLPTSWTADNQPEITGQFHPSDTTGADVDESPSVSIMHQNGYTWIELIYSTNDDPDQDVHYIVDTLGQTITGQWVDYVFHVKTDSVNGIAQVWQNGKLVVDYTGPLGYKHSKPSSFKFGIYKWPWAETGASEVSDRVAYFDDLKVAGSEGDYDDVALTPEVIADTPYYKLTLGPNVSYKSGDTVFYQLNNLTASGAGSQLFDEQGADPQNGTLTPKPTTQFNEVAIARPWYPTTLIIDLSGVYAIKYKWLYENLGTDTLNVAYGSPDHWSDTLRLKINNGGWTDADSTVIYTRYLKIWYSQHGYQKIGEMILYGHAVGDTLAPVASIPTSTEAYADGKPMGHFMGINKAGTIPPFLPGTIAGIFRNYTEQSYLDTSHVHDINDVSFVFSKFNATQIPVSYYFPVDTSFPPNYPVTFEEIPAGLDSGMYKGDYNGKYPFILHMLKDVNQMEGDSGWTRSIDYTEHPGADSTNPESYDRLSRMAWEMGAAFGKNKYPADSLQYTIPRGDSTGLNTMSYIETGNEINGSWLGAGTIYLPRPFIAYHSAVYDGDDGLMGNRFGFKRADDSIKVVMAGDAYSNRFNFLRSMNWWRYQDRPNHSWPFDVYNFHDYQYVKGSPHSALSPENYNRIGTDNIRTYWQGIVDTVQYMCPTCEVWETEWGYDRNESLENAVQLVPGQDSAQVQANWIIRSWVMQSFVKGLGASFYYMLGNANSHELDSGAYLNYATCGLVDQYTRADGSCCQTNFYAFPAYYYQRTFFQKLYNYKPDSILYENGMGDSLYCYRYVNVDNPDSVAYVVWSGTMSNASTDSFRIKTGHPSTGIAITKLADKNMDGITSSPVTDGNGEVNLTINETPQLIFTTTGTDGGILVKNNNPPPVTTLTFFKYIIVGDNVILLYKDQNGKIYSIKLP